MNIRHTLSILCALAIISACSPQEPAAPTVDVAGTLALELAYIMQTQTAGAVTSTPLPPTATETPMFTDTPSIPPTETPKPYAPAVIEFAGCYKGPGDNYTLISNIDPSIRKSGRQVVTILGNGNEPGWIVIRNPYFNNPCWIRQESMDISPATDLSAYPIMTPSP
ncbi:MAG: hypothetical protein IT314_08460 [Anaerolineales bacterium]|nr:hypothetical protein [Anaerolineales bacterium]